MRVHVVQRSGLSGLVFVCGLLLGTSVLAQPAPPASERAQTQAQTESKNQAQAQVYGWELMTPSERQAFQTRMRNATSAEEREQIRAEHHAQMQVRAEAQGVTLPDMPMDRGPGKGMQDGRGQGAGKRQSGTGRDH